MSRSALVAIMTALAVLLQAAVLNRLPVPGGIAPDLVVITVVGAALSAGPTAGAAAGFAAGLALDILPPADHELGRYAVVLCLAGYLAGRAGAAAQRSPLLPFGVVALAAVGAGLGDALIGLVLSDPRITMSSVLSALPFTLAMAMLLSPFVLYAVNRVLGRAAEDEAAYIGGGPRFGGGWR